MAVLSFYMGLGNQMVQAILFWGSFRYGLSFEVRQLFSFWSAQLIWIKFLSGPLLPSQILLLNVFHKIFNRIVCVKHPRFGGAVKDLSVCVDKNSLENYFFCFCPFQVTMNSPFTPKKNFLSSFCLPLPCALSLLCWLFLRTSSQNQWPTPPKQ